MFKPVYSRSRYKFTKEFMKNHDFNREISILGPLLDRYEQEGYSLIEVQAGLIEALNFEIMNRTLKYEEREGLNEISELRGENL